jgi:predicted transcriptional regulator
MKAATIPSLRVSPALRKAAEEVLEDGETLSAFVQQAIKARVEQRQAQHEFLQRGLNSRELAKQNGRYLAADKVVQRLEKLLTKSRKKAAK